MFGGILGGGCAFWGLGGSCLIGRLVDWLVFGSVSGVGGSGGGTSIVVIFGYFLFFFDGVVEVSWLVDRCACELVGVM